MMDQACIPITLIIAHTFAYNPNVFLSWDSLTWPINQTCSNHHQKYKFSFKGTQIQSEQQANFQPKNITSLSCVLDLYG